MILRWLIITWPIDDPETITRWSLDDPEMIISWSLDDHKMIISWSLDDPEMINHYTIVRCFKTTNLLSSTRKSSGMPLHNLVDQNFGKDGIFRRNFRLFHRLLATAETEQVPVGFWKLKNGNLCVSVKMRQNMSKYVKMQKMRQNA
jgi:hypothetical protein